LAPFLQRKFILQGGS